MPFAGTIVSHDISLHTGLVLPDGNSQAIAFTEGDVLNWKGDSFLFGQRVSFEVVQTPHGYAAIQMVLLQEKKRSLVQPGDWLASILAPVMVAGATYLLSHLFFLPTIFSYVIAINFISLLTLMLVSASPRPARPRLPEMTLLLLAFCGGAPALFLGILFIPTRFRNEGILVLLFSLLLMQTIGLKKYYPQVYDIESWRMFFHVSKLGE